MSDVNIYKPLFVTYCWYNCETGVLLYNMKCETFHLKMVADCNIIIHSTRFTGAGAWCTDAAVKRRHTGGCTVQVAHC